MRSKEKIIIEQERPKKYFFEQEKTKQKIKTINKLEIVNNNKINKITNNFEILKECKKYCQTLYTKFPTNKQEQNNLLQNVEKKISNDQNKTLTAAITEKEIQIADWKMKNGKTSGIDGLPIEFYESNFELIQNNLQQLYNAILFENKELPKTMNKAIITLILKNDKATQLKNWRPISLLCVDYKMLTKTLATRLKLILKTTISKKQHSGIPNRSMFSNLLAARELINYTNDKKQKFFIISIDQEKAFDKVD